MKDVRSIDVLASAADDVQLLLTVAAGANRTVPREQISFTDHAKRLMKRIEIEAEIRLSVLSEGVLSATEVAGLLGSGGKNARDKASRLRVKGELLGVDVDGRVLYPAFQIDATRAELRPGVAVANTAMNARRDPWSVASWWLTPHARLHEQTTPADLVLNGDVESLAALVSSATAQD